MYFELVRDVINEAVARLVKSRRLPKQTIHDGIKEQIEDTSRQYRRVNPTINYEDSLCRLGYLYMNVPINATIFEKVILNSSELRQRIVDTRRSSLNICALGGGPGTELLGVAKYLMRKPESELPSELAFTILDTIPHWAETWKRLAKAVEQEFQANFANDKVPTFDTTFLHLDVLGQASYESHDFLFRDADVIVFNYLFSENKGKLDEISDALEYLAEITSEDCAVVVIDRLEGDRQFNTKLVRLFESAFEVTIEHKTLSGRMDDDEQASEMGELQSAFGRTPRIRFYNDYGNPTVSWFVVKRA